ncbi:MAG: diguanylate cyclase [Gammaproteobacteria bacterium]|nr:diguanylate cyclase [Gammaproteobacteria bacterium]
MLESNNTLKDLHWLMDMLQNIDIGLVILDRDYKIQTWNSFMRNHSNVGASDTIGENIFDLFQDIPRNWFQRKVDSVFMLNNRAFTTWEQRPYLFKFTNNRPITGIADFMYQNITLIPLQSADGQVNHVGIIIYDVTDMAVGKQQLMNANTQLQGLSRTDMLTQLNNRGYWEECLNNEFNRIKRTGHISSLVIFDIDHFKNVNDTYGHQAGDEVIRETARMLRENMRTTDVAGRYGGEEFTVILVETTAENAKIFAERLRERIEACTIKYEDLSIKYTISLGISEVNDDITNYQEWLECSDKSLYYAKEHGRNQVVIYHQLPEQNKSSK